MELNNTIIKNLGFEFIDSPVTDDLSRGPRWIYHNKNVHLFNPMSLIMLSIEGPGCWKLFVNGNSGSSIRTLEHLISGVYEQGVRDGESVTKKFLKDWLGY
jgi:hypothetical protein